LTLSDRLGRRGILVAGFALFALVYGGMGVATGALVVWPLFALYGLYIALTDGVTKAYITDLVPATQRGGHWACTPRRRASWPWSPACSRDSCGIM